MRLHIPEAFITSGREQFSTFLSRLEAALFTFVIA